MNDKSSLVAQIVAAYAARPDASIESIVALATKLNSELGDGAERMMMPVVRNAIVASAQESEAAVTKDLIFCLCCGKGFKMLKRHLGAEHNMSEHEYREAFGLAQDYPLVAPSYSERKAHYARSVGLGKYSRVGH